MHETTCPSLSSIFVKIRNNLFFSIIPKVFNFECHNLSFLGGYVPPESPTKLCDISGIDDNVHESVMGEIHHCFSVEDWSFPFHHCESVAKIDANHSHRSLRTTKHSNEIHQTCTVLWTRIVYPTTRWKKILTILHAMSDDTPKAI